MAQNRPDKPQITLPDDFGGTQEPFSSSLVESGYEASIPQIIEGGNLNWMLNGFFQNTKYMRTVLDYVRDTPIGKMFWVNSQGQMDYVEPAIIATDNEFSTGTATDKTPNVKQVVDKFATKSDDNAVVKLTGNQTIAGTKTFSSTISGSINGNAATVTNGVYTTGNQTIAGTKTFSTTPIVGTKGNSDNSTAAASTAYVKNILAALYPVGSIYIGTQNSCPLASLISGSTWQLVAQDRALWGGNGSNGNSTINAGLPNITGTFASGCLMNWQDSITSGALSRATITQYPQNAGGTDGGSNVGISFNARSSNSIYGNSSTVQPPAYRVNVWRRTA